MVCPFEEVNRAGTDVSIAWSVCQSVIVPLPCKTAEQIGFLFAVKATGLGPNERCFR